MLLSLAAAIHGESFSGLRVRIMAWNWSSSDRASISAGLAVSTIALTMATRAEPLLRSVVMSRAMLRALTLVPAG